MLAFTTAIIFLLITPGPGVLSLAGAGAAYGWKQGLRYGTGLFFGTNMVAFAVISGLAAVLEIYPLLKVILFGLSTAYLLYLAFRIAVAGQQIAFKAHVKAPGFWDGILLQAVNPKAYVVNTTLFGGFPIMPENLFAETVIKLVILNAIWITIHLMYLAAGVGLHRLNLSPRAHTAINVFMAVAMVIVVGLAVYAQFRG